MFGLINSLQPGLSPHLLVPPRISQSVIPSFDPYKKVCPFKNDPGITMQIKYDAKQTYPNCIFGNRYKIKYPVIDENLRRGLSTFKLNNRLHDLDISKDILNSPENIENPANWMKHINGYKIHFSSSSEGWEKYCDLRGEVNSTLKCKLYGQMYNNPLDLINIIAEEIKKRSFVNRRNIMSSSSSSSSSEQLGDDQDDDNEDADDTSSNPEGVDDPSKSSAKASGGRCMDLLKALYKFIYTVSLQAWVMVHNRFLSRTNHDHSKYEYIFYLIPKDEIKDCAPIIFNTRCESMKKYREIMVQNNHDSNPSVLVNYILSVSASEFMACSLRFIIDTLKTMKVVTTNTETDQMLYAISITNVCMLNSVTLTGMQSVPINKEFIDCYNYMLAQKEGHPDDTIYVKQKFDKHFQFSIDVFVLKRVKFKNEFAFPVFISGIFFSPDRPLNKICTESEELNNEKLAVNVIRSYFTYGTYFTPNSNITCPNLPSVDISPSFLTKRCSYWYSMDEKSYLMYLSSFNPKDDVDPALHDLDLCAVSELEWALCLRDIKPFPLLKSQLKEYLFGQDVKLYSVNFWPMEYEALEHLCNADISWKDNPLSFYVLYIALTKLISDGELLDAYNINRQYKNNDHVIMYILFKSQKWKSVFECIQTLRNGRLQYKLKPSQLAVPSVDVNNDWNPKTQEAILYNLQQHNISITLQNNRELEIFEVNNIIRLSILYLSGDQRYQQQDFISQFNSFSVFEFNFKERSDNLSVCEDVMKYSKYYSGMKWCRLSPAKDKLVVYQGGVENLIQWISLYLISSFFQYTACDYFCNRIEESQRLITHERPMVSVEEVRECLAFQSTVEYKKILNLDSIFQAYKHLSDSELEVLPFKTEEYIRLLDIKNNIELRPELHDQDKLQVFDTVIKKMSRKRNREHIDESINIEEDYDNTSNSNFNYLSGGSSTSSSSSSSSTL